MSIAPSQNPLQLPTTLDSWTVGAVEEVLRLVLVPDLLETEANEQAVFAQFLEGDEWSRAIACYGDGCPVPLAEGDRVAVGVTAGTQPDRSILVEVVGFRVEAHGLCR